MPVGSHRDESCTSTAAKLRVRMPKHPGLAYKINLKCRGETLLLILLTSAPELVTTVAGVETIQSQTTIVFNKRRVIVQAHAHKKMLQGTKTYIHLLNVLQNISDIKHN